MDSFIAHYAFFFCSALFCLGLFVVVTSVNRVKKLFGLSIMQSGVMLFFIATAYVSNGRAPIIKDGSHLYANPLPHVLMLTAIVVGLSTLAVALSLAMRIKKKEMAEGKNVQRHS